MNGNTETYTLDELAYASTDAWVEAMSNLSDAYGEEVAGYDPDEDCPAEYSEEFDEVAKLHDVRFDEKGRIVEADGKEVAR